MTIKATGQQPFALTGKNIEKVIVWDKECETTIVPQGGYAPRIFVELVGNVIEQHINPTVCTVTVDCGDGKTAVVHLEVRVRDGKVTGVMTAGSLHRDVTKTVNVPVWNRKYVKGGAA